MTHNSIEGPLLIVCAIFIGSIPNHLHVIDSIPVLKLYNLSFIFFSIILCMILVKSFVKKYFDSYNIQSWDIYINLFSLSLFICGFVYFSLAMKQTVDAKYEQTDINDIRLKSGVISAGLFIFVILCIKCIKKCCASECLPIRIVPGYVNTT